MVHSCNSNYSYNKDYYYSPRNNCDGDIIGSIWNVNYNCDENSHMSMLGGLGLGAGYGIGNLLNSLLSRFCSGGFGSSGGFNGFGNLASGWNNISNGFSNFTSNFAWSGFNNNSNSLTNNFTWSTKKTDSKTETKTKDKPDDKKTETDSGSS